MTGEHRPAAAPETTRRRVLLVEDDENVGVSLAAVLERHGSDVALIPSVAIALALLRERTFDVVISDLMLDDEHGRTGFAVLSEATRCQPGITSILITGYPSEAVARRADEERIASIFSKPLDIAELLGALEAQPAAPLTAPRRRARSIRRHQPHHLDHLPTSRAPITPSGFARLPRGARAHVKRALRRGGAVRPA